MKINHLVFGVIAACIRPGSASLALLGFGVAGFLAQPEPLVEWMLTQHGHARTAYWVSWWMLPSGPQTMVNRHALTAACRAMPLAVLARLRDPAWALRPLLRLSPAMARRFPPLAAPLGPRCSALRAAGRR